MGKALKDFARAAARLHAGKQTDGTAAKTLDRPLPPEVQRQSALDRGRTIHQKALDKPKDPSPSP
jgi:hypothetical protein